MRAIEAIRRHIVTIDASASVREAAQRMATAGVGALVVTDGDRPVGIVTERDIVTRGVAVAKCDCGIEAIMTTDLVTLDADADVRDAYRVFRERALRRLPLLRGGKLAGMLTAEDLIIDLNAEVSNAYS
jgi:CBS domain-containing protein